MGVVDFGAPVTGAPVKEGTELGKEKVLPVKALSAKKQGKEKKKGKGKEKGMCMELMQLRGGQLASYPAFPHLRISI